MNISLDIFSVIFHFRIVRLQEEKVPVYVRTHNI